jgi:methionyl-tRNA formyltransferase
MLGVRRAQVPPGAEEGERPPAPPASAPADSPSPAPGELADMGGRLLYGTRAGALELLEVQPPGGRAMDAGAYLRGRELRRT